MLGETANLSCSAWRWEKSLLLLLLATCFSSRQHPWGTQQIIRYLFLQHLQVADSEQHKIDTQRAVRVPCYSDFDICLVASIFVCVQSLQLCPTLCNPVDCSPPGSSLHGILQARILHWVARPSSRGSSRHRDPKSICCGFCIVGGFFTVEPLGKPQG